MSTLDRNRLTRKDRLRLFASGVLTHYPNQTLTLAGQTINSSDLEQMLLQDIAASDATVKAHAAWRSQVEAERLSHQKIAPVLRALKSTVVAQFGDAQDASGILADFGLTPRKVTEKTVATKAAAADKARATRAARNTMGPVARKKVKGSVAPTAPATSLSNAAPAPAPAIAAPSAGTTHGT